MKSLLASELVLNPNGSIYHLNLVSEEIADTVILVGDPDRVGLVSQHFDEIEFKRQKREFVTHTGRLGKQRLSVISTGIGAGNIDIVLNECDALVNINFTTGTVKSRQKALTFICIGTCGALYADTAIDSFVVSEMAIGLDGLMHYYRQNQSTDPLIQAFDQHMQWGSGRPAPYLSQGAPELIKRFSKFCTRGITLTCPGFYGPQGRQLRGQVCYPSFIKKCQTFKLKQQRLTNLEMEAASIYALGEHLGHRCCVIKAVLANRALGQFSENPKAAVEKLIKQTLENL